MVDLARIPHRLDPEARTCRAVIETPRGSRTKYDYDPQTGGFYVKALAPERLVFPLDFGFVPSTEAEDGDPLDIMVFHEEPLAIGTLVDVRLIGVIEADQTAEGRTVRNDRVLAAACASRDYAPLREPADLDPDVRDALIAFWEQYNALQGKHFAVRALTGPDAAIESILRNKLGR